MSNNQQGNKGNMNTEGMIIIIGLVWTYWAAKQSPRHMRYKSMDVIVNTDFLYDSQAEMEAHGMRRVAAAPTVDDFTEADIELDTTCREVYAHERRGVVEFYVRD